MTCVSEGPRSIRGVNAGPMMSYRPPMMTCDWRLLTRRSLLCRNCSLQQKDLKHHLGGENQEKVVNCTDVVVSGVLDGRGDQHQHQRHDGGEPGEGGNLRNQLREETRLLFNKSGAAVRNAGSPTSRISSTKK